MIHFMFLVELRTGKGNLKRVSATSLYAHALSTEQPGRWACFLRAIRVNRPRWPSPSMHSGVP